MHFLPEKIDEYIVAHSQQEPTVLQELSKETWQKILLMKKSPKPKEFLKP